MMIYCTLLILQSFSAGIGNYYADEILYQARVYPGVPGRLQIIHNLL